MPLCGSSSCDSCKADLKCARCHGVFYCNAACQKADWKRHKAFCKALPASAAAATPARQLAHARVSASKLDVELFRVVDSFLKKTDPVASFLSKTLPSVMKEARDLLDQGALPDVLIECNGVNSLTGGPVTGCLAIVCSAGCRGMEPLL